MRIAIFRAWFLSPAVALVTLWLALPSVANAQPFAGAAGMHAHYLQGIASFKADADCESGLGSAQADGCCSSTFGCCAANSLLAAEPEAVLEDGAPVPVAVNSETAD